MMQLSIEEEHGSDSNPRVSSMEDSAFRVMHQCQQNWPGIKGYWHGFVDPVFGKYKDTQELVAMEMLEAEEEDYGYMDATAQSESVESTALEGPVNQDEAGLQADGRRASSDADNEGLTTDEPCTEGERTARLHESDNSGESVEIDSDKGSALSGDAVEAAPAQEEVAASDTRVHKTDALTLLKVRTK